MKTYTRTGEQLDLKSRKTIVGLPRVDYRGTMLPPPRRHARTLHVMPRSPAVPRQSQTSIDIAFAILVASLTFLLLAIHFGG